MRKYRDILCFIIGIIILLFFIGNVCPLENIVGIPCPGCNMFTALYWLLKGNIELATYYHPAWLPFLIYALFCGFLYWKYKKDMKYTLIFKVSSIIFLLIFLGTYAYRMLTIFPNVPLQLNEEAIFVRIFHLF